MEPNREERNRYWLKRTFKIRNMFLLSRTHSKSGTHFKSGMCSNSSRIFLNFNNLVWSRSVGTSSHIHIKRYINKFISSLYQGLSFILFCSRSIESHVPQCCSLVVQWLFLGCSMVVPCCIWHYVTSFIIGSFLSCHQR